MKGEGEGGLVGRALDWYTVLGKSWVGPWGVLWQKLPHREVAHWAARPLVERGQNKCAVTAKGAGESKNRPLELSAGCAPRIKLSSRSE